MKETLEEDLKFPIIIENGLDYLNLTTKIFNNGAKWQQERSYSEEDIKLAFNEGYDVCRYVTDNRDEAKECFDDWFEQFKKK
jgi:hypothetical protein